MADCSKGGILNKLKTLQLSKVGLSTIKVMQQHPYDVVGNLIWVLVEI